MTVSAEQRSALARAVARLRRIFEEDFASLAEGKFGIHVSETRAGELEDVSALSLSAQDLASRAELVGVLDYLKHEGLSPAEAVDRMLREAVFTTVNRLLAIRVAEAIGILPASLAQGRTSQGFLEAVEAFPLLRDADTSGGYWTYLQICGDELSHAVPRLFDRRHPLTALAPSPEAVNEAVEVLADTVLADVWTEPEALGWSYQFFNTSEERRAMRESAPAPRDSRELAVRNQFFTPRYVVDFLVQNTLGRRLRASGFDLDLPLLLGEVHESPEPLDLDEVAILDPAVGSGHFLLGAYDLLERAWETKGTPPGQAAPLILASLHGIEIDPRAAQVAQAVLYLRARRSAPEARLEPPSIITARSLPHDPEVKKPLLTELTPAVRDIVDSLSDILDNAPSLGSLLRVEESIHTTVNARLTRPQLGDDASMSFEEVERQVLDAINKLVARSKATPAERLFAAEATDALEFVRISNTRFDAVLMNPPFGEPIPSTKEYLKASWPWIPWKDYNLLAAFVGRGLEWLKPTGYLGAITSRAAFFLSTFEEWRRHVVLGNGLVVFADLGFGVMEEATVEAAAYVIRRGPSAEATFVRLLREDNKATALATAVTRLQAGEHSDLVDVVALEELRVIPGLRFNYWLPEDIRSLYADLPSLGDGDSTEVRVGLQTSDDFRFLRAHWEVDPQLIAQDLDETRRGKRWVLLAKGGEYSPYYTDHHLVVDWEDDGQRIRATGRKARVQNTAFYFEPGLTWPERTNSAFGPQVLPAGAIFSVKGPLIWASNQPDLLPLLAWVNSRVVRLLIEASVASGEETRTGGVPSRDYSVGLVADLPSPLSSLSSEDRDAIASAAEDLLWTLRRLWNSDETTRFFEIPDVVRFRSVPAADRMERIARYREDQALKVLELHLELEQLLHKALDLPTDLPVLDEVAGPQRAAFPDRDLSEEERQIAFKLLDAPVADAIEATANEHGKRRFIQLNYHMVDRRLETVSFLLGVHPRILVEERRRAGHPPGELTEAAATDLLSWLVGAAFGRFDVRVGAIEERANQLRDLFDPVPPLSPGMLPEDVLWSGYPVPIPASRVLVDDPRHESDIVRMVEAAAAAVFDDPEEEIRWALRFVGAADLRSYLRSSFSGLHTVRYTKSRRKAPIYWYLAVPSKQWGLWMYAPALSREQLFSMARTAQDKVRRLGEEAAQLRRDLEAGGARSIRERLEAVDSLSREVAEFVDVIDRVAQSGWEPDLNDGIVLNAAPLEQLFADAKWRKDVAEQRKKMEKGEYPWATVQRTYFKGSR